MYDQDGVDQGVLQANTGEKFAHEVLRHSCGDVLGKCVAEGGDFKTLEQGAATSVWCATSLRLAGRGNVYCQDVDIAEVRPPDSISNLGVSPSAIDPKITERLWTLSEDPMRVKVDS